MRAHGLPVDHDAVQGSECGRGDALAHPAFGGGRDQPVSLGCRDQDPRRSSPSRFTYSLLRIANAVSAGPFAAGPVLSPSAIPMVAAVAGDLNAVGRSDPYGITPSSDPIGGHVPPFGAELLQRPVGPGGAAIGRDSPAIPDRTVPDLAPAPEAECMNEIPGQTRRGRSSESVHGICPGSEAQDTLPRVPTRGRRADPRATVRTRALPIPSNRGRVEA